MTIADDFATLSNVDTFSTPSQIADHFCAPIVVHGWIVEVVAYGCKYVYRYGRNGYEIQPNIIALQPAEYADDIADDCEDFDPDGEF